MTNNVLGEQEKKKVSINKSSYNFIGSQPSLFQMQSLRPAGAKKEVMSSAIVSHTQ